MTSAAVRLIGTVLLWGCGPSQPPPDPAPWYDPLAAHADTSDGRGPPIEMQPIPESEP